MTALSPVWLKIASDQEFIQRLLQREGGTDKITTDSGGVTRGGVAETSGMPAAQIRALTPEKINQIWLDKWKGTEGLTHPGIREILFDMRGNAGEPRANRLFQNSVNALLPKDRRIPEDGVVGSGTLAAANTVMQDDLADKMMDNFRRHHERLVAKNPTKYSPYAKGWENRRASLWKSPALSDLHRATPAPPAIAPVPSPVSQPVAPIKPTLVKGTPPTGATVISPLTKQSALSFKEWVASTRGGAAPAPKPLGQNALLAGFSPEKRSKLAQVLLYKAAFNPSAPSRQGPLDGAGRSGMQEPLTPQQTSALPGDLGRAFYPAPGTTNGAVTPMRLRGNPLLHRRKTNVDSDWARWSDTAGRLAEAKNPLFEPAEISPSGWEDVPAIYNQHGSGWRAPLYKSIGNTGEKIKEAPLASSRMAEDFNLWRNGLDIPNLQYSAGEGAPTHYYYNKGAPGQMTSGISVDTNGNPLAAVTHEYEHALGGTERANGPYQMAAWKKYWETAYPDSVSGFFANNAKWAPWGKSRANKAEDAYRRLRYATSETPAVMAETVASLRGMEEARPGAASKLNFGAPGYEQANGEFIRREGSKHMYGLDPDTNQRIDYPRSMTDLLSTREGEQWLQRLGRRKLVP